MTMTTRHLATNHHRQTAKHDYIKCTEDQREDYNQRIREIMTRDTWDWNYIVETLPAIGSDIIPHRTSNRNKEYITQEAQNLINNIKIEKTKPQPDAETIKQLQKQINKQIKKDKKQHMLDQIQNQLDVRDK
eukprot:11658233-Karenia_brevis.AAC.1